MSSDDSNSGSQTDSSSKSSSAAKGEACPPKPGNKNPCKGLRKILAIHEAKLAQYLNDPSSMDNQGRLKYALDRGNMDLFWKIRPERIKILKSDIELYRKQLEECERRYG